MNQQDIRHLRVAAEDKSLLPPRKDLLQNLKQTLEFRHPGRRVAIPSVDEHGVATERAKLSEEKQKRDPAAGPYSASASLPHFFICLGQRPRHQDALRNVDPRRKVLCNLRDAAAQEDRSDDNSEPRRIRRGIVICGVKVGHAAKDQEARNPKETTGQRGDSPRAYQSRPTTHDAAGA